MPAPAVIPAPIAYIKVVAVKKLVVGFWGALVPSALNWVGGYLPLVYFEKIRVFKADGLRH